MRSTLFLVLSFLFLSITSAFAGPSGTYEVAGTDPGNVGNYTGTVTVNRTGSTYSVVWSVNGTEYIGTAVGAASVKGTMTFGDAAENDTAIAVSYVSGKSFGLALYAEQENGQWKGIWTYGGSEKIGNETWTRAE